MVKGLDINYPLSVTISDMAGKVLSQNGYNVQLETDYIPLNTTSLSNGVYLISYQNGNKIGEPLKCLIIK